MEVKRVGPWSVARVLGAIYAVIGVIAGALFACAALLGSIFTPQNSDSTAFGAGIGVGAIVLFPIIYGVLVVVGGALTAWLYNIFAGMVGGIEVQLEPPQANPIP